MKAINKLFIVLILLNLYACGGSNDSPTPSASNTKTVNGITPPAILETKAVNADSFCSSEPGQLCATVSIDDGEEIEMSFSAETGQASFESPSLETGEHTLAITWYVTGDNNPHHYILAQSSQSFDLVSQGQRITPTPYITDFNEDGDELSNLEEYMAGRNINGNTPPTSNAGVDFSVLVDSNVALNGLGEDLDNDSLSYNWTIISQPAGSNIQLGNANSATPSFIASTLGTYVFELVVSDGQEQSQADQVTVTASDSPLPTVNLSLDKENPNENSGGVILDVTLSSVPAQAVSVTMDTTQSTALAGEDFEPLNGVKLIFDPQAVDFSLKKQVVIIIHDDSIYEGQETFKIRAISTNTSNPLINKDIVINDDDPMPTISFNSTDDIEILEETGATVELSLSLSAKAQIDITAQINVAGNALESSDFTLSEVVFPAGETSANLTLSVIDDDDIEARESITLSINQPPTSQRTIHILPVIKAIDAGNHHTCVVTIDGAVKCWGWNMWGQLGIGQSGNTGDEENEMGPNLPLVKLGVNDRVKQVYGNVISTCALLESEEAKCWGINFSTPSPTYRGSSSGSMGDNLPTVDLGEGVHIKKLTSHGQHTACAIVTKQGNDEALKCWGDNSMGQLGLEDTNDRGDEADEMGDNLPNVNIPIAFIDSVYGSPFFNCAVFRNINSTMGNAYCWGYAISGYLGYPYTYDSVGIFLGDEPGEMGENLWDKQVDFGTQRLVKKMSLAYGGSCAILDNGRVKCFGANSQGMLGLGDTDARGDDEGEMGDNLPYVELGEGRTAIDISSNTATSCAILDNQTVKCWGDNSRGQLGQGDMNNRGDEPDEMGDNLTPIDLGTGLTVKSITSGLWFNCALFTNGKVKCWGRNEDGQLGLGDTENRGDEPGEMGDDLPFVNIF